MALLSSTKILPLNISRARAWSVVGALSMFTKWIFKYQTWFPSSVNLGLIIHTFHYSFYSINIDCMATIYQAMNTIMNKTKNLKSLPTWKLQLVGGGWWSWRRQMINKWTNTNSIREWSVLLRRASVDQRSRKDFSEKTTCMTREKGARSSKVNLGTILAEETAGGEAPRH